MGDLTFIHQSPTASMSPIPAALMQKINTKHLPDLDVTTKQPIFHEKDSGSC
jgi:hypothetical protein